MITLQAAGNATLSDSMIVFIQNPAPLQTYYRPFRGLLVQEVSHRALASQSLKHAHFHIAARITLDISQQRVERHNGVVEMLVEFIVAGELS